MTGSETRWTKYYGVTQLTLNLKQTTREAFNANSRYDRPQYYSWKRLFDTVNCDLLNSAKVNGFGGEQVSYTLFRSTVNSICPVNKSTTTTIGLYKKLYLPLCLMRTHTMQRIKLSCLKKTTLKTSPILKARVMVTTHRLWYYCSSQIFCLSLWPSNKERFSLWFNFWNNTVFFEKTWLTLR